MNPTDAYRKELRKKELKRGFLSLSGSILLQVYLTIFNAGPTPYILMLALLPLLNTLLFMFSVRAFQTNEVDEKRHLNVKARPLEQFEDTSMNELLNNISHNQVFLEEDDKNLVQAICTVNFWCLFLTTAAGMGTGLATVNNLAQVGESLGYASSETSTLVSLWSIWNFVDRFGVGYVSDHFLYTKKWARPVFIAITLALMSIGHVVIASGMPGALYVGSILVGVFYGSQWSLMPTIASEIFGVSHFGTIFNTITIAGPIGSYVTSVRVIGYLYDRSG